MNPCKTRLPCRRVSLNLRSPAERPVWGSDTRTADALVPRKSKTRTFEFFFCGML
jgi:hypothetical protein